MKRRFQILKKNVLGKTTLFIAIFGFTVLAIWKTGLAAPLYWGAMAESALRDAKSTLDPDDFLVCTITLNSTDERDQMERRYSQGRSKGRFTFLELTHLAYPDSKGDWLKTACTSMESSGLECDQLVISGHFGGEFSGDTQPHRLSLHTLEQLSCDHLCASVLRAPAEVFLLGCNTLSGKEQDSRTPEQYIQVLMSHGDSRIEAERVADERYGSTQVSNRDRMMSVFSSRQQLYGFDSIAPLGSNIRSSFAEYLSDIDPVQHLTTLRQRQLEESLHYLNHDIESALGTNYNFCQVSSNPVEESDPRSLSCPLVSESSSRLTRLKAIEAILNSDHPERFVTLIEQSLRSASESLQWAGEYNADEIATLGRISASNGKTTYLSAIDETLRMGLWSRAIKLGDLALMLGWMTPAEYASKLKKPMLELAKLSGTSTDSSPIAFLCHPRDATNRPKVSLTASEIESLHLPSFYSTEALACIAQPEPENPTGPYRTSLGYFSRMVGGNLNLSATETQSLINGLKQWFPNGLSDVEGNQVIAAALTKNPKSDVYGKAAHLLNSPPLPEPQAVEVIRSGIGTRDAFTLLEACALLRRVPSTPNTRSLWLSNLNSPMSILTACLTRDSEKWVDGLSDVEYSAMRPLIQDVIVNTQDDETRRDLFSSYAKTEKDSAELTRVVIASIASSSTRSREKAIMLSTALARVDLTQTQRAELLTIIRNDPHLASNLQYYARATELSALSAIQLLTETLPKPESEKVSDWAIERLAATTSAQPLTPDEAMQLAGLIPVAPPSQLPQILSMLPVGTESKTETHSLVYAVLSQASLSPEVQSKVLFYLTQAGPAWIPSNPQPLLRILQAGNSQDVELAARVLSRTDPRNEAVELAAISALRANPQSVELRTLIAHMQPLTLKARRAMKRALPSPTP